jgi:hypothetical protein
MQDAENARERPGPSRWSHCVRRRGPRTHSRRGVAVEFVGTGARVAAVMLVSDCAWLWDGVVPRVGPPCTALRSGWKRSSGDGVRAATARMAGARGMCVLKYKYKYKYKIYL